MREGFIRAAAATPKVRVADPQYNGERVIELMEEGFKRGVKLMVFPELCLTAYTCGDLFLQSSLLEGARESLRRLAAASRDKDMLVFAGLPWEHEGKLCNVAAAVKDGEVLGLVTKKNLPNYSEFYEAQHFCPGPDLPELVDWEGKKVPMGVNLLFRCASVPGLTIAGEICEDL